MEQERWSLRVGAAAIGCAIVLRLVSVGFFDPLTRLLQQPEMASFLLYLETGRIVRTAAIPAETLPAAAEIETVPGEEAVPMEIEPAVFTGEDAQLIEMKYSCDYRPDIAGLLEAPLDWDLTGEAPTVLILHTHATESYTKAGEDYEESTDYRTLDEAYNMLSIGDRLEALLEANGITVLHDRTLHDYPSYNGSYANARQTIAAYLEEYPSIQLVLDLHRDAAEDGNGNQVAATAYVDGGEVAQLMLVLGTDAGGLNHPNWQENLALAVKLQAQLEKQASGICRPIHLTSQRYNEDMSSGALLIEVGAAGNTRAQALAAVEYLADGILALAKGANITP